jgi:hypothetical protein
MVTYCLLYEWKLQLQARKGLDKEDTAQATPHFCDEKIKGGGKIFVKIEYFIYFWWL